MNQMDELLALLFPRPRVEALARKLWPSDYHNGEDCGFAQSLTSGSHPGIRGKGEPCPVCQERLTAWNERVAELQKVIRESQNKSTGF